MSYGQQWLHCCSFTITQLTNRFESADSVQKEPVLAEPTKEQVIEKLKAMYHFVYQTIERLPDASLFEEVAYTGDTVAGWRLLSILENHIIHHRGQCMVYLRLKGVTPEGYLGW